jgi:hypothetical protein
MPEPEMDLPEDEEPEDGPLFFGVQINIEHGARRYK